MFSFGFMTLGVVFYCLILLRLFRHWVLYYDLVFPGYFVFCIDCVCMVVVGVLVYLFCYLLYCCFTGSLGACS